MKEKDGGPVFPIIVEPTMSVDDYGMSLRDHFAAEIMAGVASRMALNIGNDGIVDMAKAEPLARGLATSAYLVADAMLKERAK